MRSNANPDGMTALVTGGTKGIGRGVAEAMVDAGMNVLITARSEDDVTRAEAELAERGGGRARGVVCDVRDLDQQRRAVEAALDAFGRLDVLVANAGVGAFAPVEEIDPETWARVIDTNLTGVFYSVAAAVDALRASEGLIVTIGSLAGVNTFAGGAAYNASKFGLLGFTQAAMLDLRKHGVRVSTIMPGSVATHFGGSAPSDADAWKIQPEDVAALVMQLVTMPARTLPSKIEVRPSRPPSAR